jgi:hypothetical protein
MRRSHACPALVRARANSITLAIGSALFPFSVQKHSWQHLERHLGMRQREQPRFFGVASSMASVSARRPDCQGTFERLQTAFE